jgi:hypothetical protein
MAKTDYVEQVDSAFVTQLGVFKNSIGQWSAPVSIVVGG